MSDKLRFSFLMRPREAEALKRIAEAMDRSQGAALRTLIRKADRELYDPTPINPSPSINLQAAAHGEQR